MSLFSVKRPQIHQYYEKRPWEYSVRSDPSYVGRIVIITRKEHITFEDVLKVFLKGFGRGNYLGAMSVIYWKYYNEFYEFLEKSLNDEVLKKKYKRAVVRFYKRYLKRWIKFVKYSDDIKYPQNNVFRKMYYVIINTYKNLPALPEEVVRNTFE